MHVKTDLGKGLGMILSLINIDNISLLTSYPFFLYLLAKYHFYVLIVSQCKGSGASSSFQNDPE